MAIRNVHPFPARMASEIALEHLRKAEGDGKKSSYVVIDPMCGSGTVLSSAASMGYCARGFDMDPLAVLMSSVATCAVDGEQVCAEAAAAVEHARDMSNTPILWDDDETRAFAEFWFGEKQRDQLSRLASALSDCESEAIRNVLDVALSRIIDTKAPKASLAADTSHSRPHRVLAPADNDYDVYRGFIQSARHVSRIVSAIDYSGSASATLGDARQLNVKDGVADLIITSPPYLNAIDYMRGHKLSLIWLGYSIPQLRKIRSNCIGAERATSAERAMLASSIIEELKQSKDDVPNPRALPSGTLERYVGDLIELATEMKRIAKPGAEIITVIGNSSIKGNFIRNDTIMSKALERAGATIVSSQTRPIPESSRYLPIRTSKKDSPISRRMREEVVITAQV